MKINIRRTGGFAGISEEIGAVDTQNLDADTGRDIENRIKTIGFFGLPEQVGGPGADLFHLEITVVDKGRTHKVSVAEEDREDTDEIRSVIAGIIPFAVR